jgi:hypothetical protein
MTGSLPASDCRFSPPTSLPFDTSFATIARWVDGKIVEEHEFLDFAGIMQQIGATTW